MTHMKPKTTKIAVPRSLEMAITKIRAELELDWDAACEHLASLADPNGKRFKAAVGRDANRRYKSRHLAELNKAKKTFTDKGYNTGYSKGEKVGQKIGRALGLDEATRKHRISFPCGRCGKSIHLSPDGPATKAAVEHLTEAGWRHGECHEN